MLKQIKVAAMALLAVGFAASCNNSETASQAEARESLENSVQPATPQPAAAQAAAPAGPTTTMEFDATEFDFGTVQDGEKVSHTYTFKNTGSEPLILSNAKGSCGCTVPSWPREPIAPGETGEITVEFNSKNKKGRRNQKVTITANTNPPQSFIYLKGEVMGDATAAPAVTQ
ncbi:DUF1573 domain-containing protein [Phaeodactylibacter luteus]|uniref:DUF1573 domain-containing protein n=1 Tax=Phaeodactylibacter luteus TaxID=1564516 RepID=A0A5C6RX56_9BACT|nr:DUF1573 domain-containing protein [Phaeodactylibacter luteus]TXB66575.1 DUF1573 domain-containing protein [Phaeodactylibacter luteus]